MRSLKWQKMLLEAFFDVYFGVNCSGSHKTRAPFTTFTNCLPNLEFLSEFLHSNAFIFGNQFFAIKCVLEEIENMQHNKFHYQ